MERRALNRQRRYLVLREKGLEFIETWFGAPKCVPPNLTKMYQLLLHMVTMKGTIPMYLAFKLGYSEAVVNEAVKRKYVELSLVPKKPPKSVLKRIRDIIGEPPREMFA